MTSGQHSNPEQRQISEKERVTSNTSTTVDRNSQKANDAKIQRQNSNADDSKRNILSKSPYSIEGYAAIAKNSTRNETKKVLRAKIGVKGMAMDGQQLKKKIQQSNNHLNQVDKIYRENSPDKKKLRIVPKKKSSHNKNVEDQIQDVNLHINDMNVHDAI